MAVVQPDEFELNENSPSMSSGSPSPDRGYVLPETELKRDLGEIHVNMIAFSACVGIGLFLQSGRFVYLAGPGLAIIAYLLIGTVIGSVVSSLGEMTALFPMPGALYLLPCRFLDEAIGFASGWLSWFAWVVIIATEVLAVSQLWNFEFDPQYLKNVDYPRESLAWGFGQRYVPAVWVVIFLIVILLTNFLPVLYYGWVEYFFGCLKIVFIVGLIMFNVVVNAMKLVVHNPNSRFWTYDQPYSFTSKNMTLRYEPSGDDLVKTGNLGIFLAMWTAMTGIIFSMIGVEAVCIASGECKKLGSKRSVMIASRKITGRVVLLYALATAVVGFNVPYTDANLRDYAINDFRSGQHSIFVISAVRNHLTFWPGFFNAFFIFSATSAGINSLYIASRILHSLAGQRQIWPETAWAEYLREPLERTTYGVPYYAIGTSWLFGLLAFLATSHNPAIVLGRMATNAVVSILIVYAIVCATYVRFHRRIVEVSCGHWERTIAAGTSWKYDRNSRAGTFPYRSRAQPFRALYGGICCALLAIFNGWQSFVNPFNVADFLASYISIPIFLGMVIYFKWQLQQRQWLHASMNLTDPEPRVVEDHDEGLREDNTAGWKAVRRIVTIFA